MNFRLLLPVVIIVVIASGCLTEEEPAKTLPISQGKAIAEMFIKSAPTYRYDGIEGSLSFDAVYSGGCEECLNLVYYFESGHAGYGDRSGKALAEAITPHTIEIFIKAGRVSSAIIDYKWDEISQKELDAEKPAELTNTVTPGSTFEMFSGQTVKVEGTDMSIRLLNVVHRECNLGTPCTNPEFSAELEVGLHGYVRKVKIILGQSYQFPNSVSLHLTNLKLNTVTFSLVRNS